MFLKFFLLAVFAFFMLLWGLLAALLVGYLPLEALSSAGLPATLVSALQKIELPTSTAALGDSMAVLDGLLSSVAIMLGLVAVLLQGRELRASNEAQREQAENLARQLKMQKRSNDINAYATAMQALQWDAERLEKVVGRLSNEIKLLTDPEAKAKKEQIRKNSIALMRKKRIMAERIYDEKLEILIEGL